MKWFVIAGIVIAVIFISLEIRDQILLRKIRKEEQAALEEQLKELKSRQRRK